MRKVEMVSAKDIRNRRAFRRILVCLLLLIGIGGVLWLALIALDKQSQEAGWQSGQKDLDKKIAAVRSGQTKSIYFYCSVGTDRLLERLADVPEVEEVILHLTDVTDDGMKSLVAMKHLKSFTIVGGRPGVGDRGFSYISTIATLEHLEMVNTQVTNQSLPSLKDLPNLRSLTLCRSAHSTFRSPEFTAAGLQDLKALTNLKRLEVSGGLASDAAVKELREALPNCAINEKREDAGVKNQRQQNKD
jgi:hypothetical protein